MHGHLIAIEVGVVSRANKWMNANRFAFDQLRLESLDRQSMQRGRAVQEHRMSTRDFVENVPNFGRLPLDHFLRAANGVDVSEIFQSANDEWFEKNERHLLRQTALMQFQFGTDDDNRTAGVIDALAEEILTEPSALALEHVAE